MRIKMLCVFTILTLVVVAKCSTIRGVVTPPKAILLVISMDLYSSTIQFANNFTSQEYKRSTRLINRPSDIKFNSLLKIAL